MCRLYLILLLSIIYCEQAYSQIVRSRVDFFNSGAYDEQFTDALAVTTNPAALVFCRSFTSGVYGERKFLLQELQHMVFSVALPVANDGIGVQAAHLSSPTYKHTTAGLGYAQKLGRAIIGVRFHFNNMVVPGYTKSNNIDIEAGTHFRLTDQLRMAMCVYFPAAGNRRAAYRYRMGIGYKVSEQVLMVFEAGKDEGKPMNIHAGVYYRPTPRWMMQVGINTSGSQPYLCSGFQVGSWRILVTVIHSLQLGPTPGLALLFPPKTATL